ncbi:phenol hydroxylase [Aspergillus spectabilis]
MHDPGIWHLQERLPSNGRWRVMVFAGDVTKPSQKEKIERLGAALGSKISFLQRYKPAGASYNSIIEEQDNDPWHSQGLTRAG